MKSFYSFLFVLLSCAILSAAESKGLILHLPLNEGPGEAVKDIGPKKLTGKICDFKNGASWVEGRGGGKALAFTGVNGKAPYVFVNGFKPEEFSNGMTVMCYVKLNKDKYQRTSIWRFITSNRNSRGFLLAIHYQRLIFGGDRNKLTRYAVSNNSRNPIRGGEWLHWAATHDGKGVFKVYIDGALADVSSEKMQGPITISNGAIAIGSSYGYSVLEGAIADVKLYNKALSDKEIMMQLPIKSRSV